MATEIAVEARPETVFTRSDEPSLDTAPLDTSLRPAASDKQHTILDAFRAFGIVIGPSILFDIVTLGSVPALLSRRLRPFAAVGTAALAAYWLVVRPWHLRWGATDAEVAKPLPGDDLEPEPAIQMTRAITVDAPVEEVWPWLAQIGQERGGFYSYEWVENLAGCRMKNADRVHPEWQRREVGETIMLHPASGLKVSHFEPNRVFGIEHWGVYVVEPTHDGTRTRLIGRARVGRGPAALFYALCIEIPHFVMERKMLLGIKERAELRNSPASPERQRS
jgi:hypothetical protein